MRAFSFLGLFINVSASSVELVDLFAGLAEPSGAQGGPALGFVFCQQPLDDVFDLRQQLAVAGEVGDFHVDFGTGLVWPRNSPGPRRSRSRSFRFSWPGAARLPQKLALLLGFVV